MLGRSRCDDFGEYCIIVLDHLFLYAIVVEINATDRSYCDFGPH